MKYGETILLGRHLGTLDARMAELAKAQEALRSLCEGPAAGERQSVIDLARQLNTEAAEVMAAGGDIIRLMQQGLPKDKGA